MVYGRVSLLVSTEGDSTLDAALNDLGMWKEDAVPVFVRSRFCTDHCGKSMFEDWQHTPLCEKRYAESEEI